MEAKITTNKERARQTNRQADTQTKIMTIRQANKQTKRRTDR